MKSEKQNKTLIIVAMIVSYLPFLIFSNPPEANIDSIILYLASQTGYLAAIMLLWQFILGTRSIAGFILKDQAWALKLHKWFGVYGIALVLLHPILVAYSYSEDLLYLIQPDFSVDFEKYVSFGRFAFLLYLIVWFSSAILRGAIKYRPWKTIHWLSYLVLPFVLVHTPQVGSFYAGSEIIRTLWTGFIILFTAILALRLRHTFTFGQYPYEITGKKETVPDVFMYKLSPRAKQIKPAPGQYIYTRRSFFSEEHPFSVVSTDKDGSITIATKVFGKYTKKLSELSTGDSIYLDGPYGVFTQELSLQDSEKPVVFIAGGIGITPFISHILQNDRDITLFNANRTEQQAFLRNTLKKVLGDKYIEVLSDDPNSSAESGYVTTKLLKKYLGDSFATLDYYICGPPIMMSMIKQDLIDSGIKHTSIHTEEFSF